LCSALHRDALLIQIDYLVGRKSGYYWPNLIPSYQKKEDKIDYTRVMTEQLFRESIRKGFSSL